jgi:hypothetical protein
MKPAQRRTLWIAGAAIGLGAVFLLVRKRQAPRGAFIIGGKAVPTGAPVATWAETGLAFPGLRKRKETRGVVLHWSGNPSETATPEFTYRTLVDRGLSVQLSLARDGTFWQFADLDDRASHAGDANEAFIGIEIVGKGDFTQAQMKSLLAGLETILSHYQVPWIVGRPRVLSASELQTFRGILGHYMVSGDKLDPGHALMYAVATRSTTLVG